MVGLGIHQGMPVRSAHMTKGRMTTGAPFARGCVGGETENCIQTISRYKGQVFLEV